MFAFIVKFFHRKSRHLETAAELQLHQRGGSAVAIRVEANRNTVTDLDLLLEEVDFVLLLQELLLLPRDLWEENREGEKRDEGKALAIPSEGDTAELQR